MAEGAKVKLHLIKPIKAPSGFTIVPVHYTMDPDKQSPDWYLQEQAKYRRESIDWQKQWDREMELDFTTVSGSPAYPAFTDLNLRNDLIYNESCPLCLCCDFNVEPMIWEIAQVIRVDDWDIPLFIDEIMLSPASVEDMVDEFRNRYPAHPAELWIYGDATAKGRSHQTMRSSYDLIRLAFRGYSSSLRFKIPPANPDQRDRLNAFNLVLKDPDGRPHCFINPDKCPHLVKDLREVVTKEDGSRLVKSAKRDDPYFWRTHASDAAGYFIYREWPVRREVLRSLPKRRTRRVYRNLLGEM